MDVHNLNPDLIEGPVGVNAEDWFVRRGKPGAGGYRPPTGPLWVFRGKDAADNIYAYRGVPPLVRAAPGTPFANSRIRSVLMHDLETLVTEDSAGHVYFNGQMQPDPGAA